MWAQSTLRHSFPSICPASSQTGPHSSAETLALPLWSNQKASDGIKEVANTRERVLTRSCCLDTKPGELRLHQPHSTRVPLTPGCQHESMLATPFSTHTPGCKMLQLKHVPASGVCWPLGSQGPSSPRPSASRTPGCSCTQPVPRLQGKRFIFFFVIKRFSQKLFTDLERTSEQ